MTGLLYNYYRDYDPSLGRYVQSDPIGLLGGINTYSYAYGNPVGNIDPDGRLVLQGINAMVGGVLGGYGAFQVGATVENIVGASLVGAASNAIGGRATFTVMYNLVGNLAFRPSTLVLMDSTSSKQRLQVLSVDWIFPEGFISRIYFPIPGYRIN